MKPVSFNFNRTLSVLPLITAIIFHAVALERWLLGIPALVGMAVFVSRETAVTITSRLVYLAAGAGMIAGLVIPVANVTSGTLPSVVIGVATGVLICVAILCAFADKLPITWVLAWAIATFSASVPMTTSVSTSLFVFLMGSLLVAAWQIDLFRSRYRAIVQLSLFVVFVAMVALATAGIAAAARQVDRMLLLSAHVMVPSNSPSSTSGLSDNITLHSQNSITLTQRPVLELSRLSSYLRTKVLDEFDGRQWSTSSRLSSTSHTFSEIVEETASTDAEPLWQLEVVFLRDLGDILPSPAGTRGVHNVTLRITGGWILRGTREVTTIVMVGTESGMLPTETEPTADDIAIPIELQQQLGPLAKQLTESAGTNVAKAGEIEAFFHKDFEYSLKTDLSGDAHPLVIMINERRPAYCVYFASAMAVMLRSQGIAARVVSGFAPAEVNRFTGRVTVRDRDAHAWVEVWSPEQARYVAFDPTPINSRLEVMGHAGTSGVFASAVAAIRSQLRRIGLVAVNDPLSLLWMLIESPMFWIAFVVCVFVIRRRFRKRSAVEMRNDTAAVDPGLREVYNQYVRALQQAGITPQSWETDEEIIARLAASDASSISDAARDFITRYQASRFGGVVPDEQLRSSPILR